MARLTQAIAVGAALAAAACSALGGPAPTPSPKAELVFGLPPSRASQSQVAAAQQFAAQLSGLIKVPVIVKPEPTLAMLDAELAAGVVDLAWSDSLTYVALRQRHPYQPVVQAGRCFPTYTASPPPPNCRPQPGTPAIIICGSSVPIPELADSGDWSAVKGKRFAFEDPSSLAGYVWPRYFLSRNHVEPDQDLGKGPPTPSDVAVALAVYDGLVDCGAIAGDGRAGATPIAPDIFDRTKVVFVAPGNVPGDTVYTGWRLNATQAARLRDALIRLGVTPTASAAIAQLSGATALLPATDRDFDLLRAAVGTVNPKLIDQLLPTPSPTRPATPTATHR